MAVKIGNRDVVLPNIDKIYLGNKLVYPAYYLEIDPEIVWLFEDWASNDVYSNTVWRVD